MEVVLVISAIAGLIVLGVVAPRVALGIICAPFVLWAGLIVVLLIKG